MTLTILAAGLGSRYGGLKQLDPITPNGQFIIDYSIFDALRAGIDRVVFIIKKENEELFRETIGDRIADYIKVEYAYQDVNMLPAGRTCPEGRTKPWGTGHALLCAKDVIGEDKFLVINAMTSTVPKLSASLPTSFLPRNWMTASTPWRALCWRIP